VARVPSSREASRKPPPQLLARGTLLSPALDRQLTALFAVLQETIMRSKEDALARLRSFEEQIRSGQATLCELASTESDCSSAKQQGDLGFFGANQMMRTRLFYVYLLILNCRSFF
jgi:hypothetical protein